MPAKQSLHSYHGMLHGQAFEMCYRQSGCADTDVPIVVWGHGWGQDHRAFDVLMKPFDGMAQHICLDFPGFGHSPVPFERMEDSWGSHEYAQAVAAFLRESFPGRAVIWVAHSFGVRVGVQLAAQAPELVSAMAFIAGAGLKRKRSALEWLCLKGKIYSYKLGKFLWRMPISRVVLSALGVEPRGGSADYQKAGPMRGVLVKVVNEHLAQEAASIRCPVLLFYGDKDTETPVDVGQSYHSLIQDSKLYILPGQDHYSVLAEGGRHLIQAELKQLIGK